MDPRTLVDDWHAARGDLWENLAAIQANRARLVENRDRLKHTTSLLHSNGRGLSPDHLRWSTIARLEARLVSQPVIEQAKGIIIGDSGCNADEAFEILRRASQRTNKKVRDLAAEIVVAAQQRHGVKHPPRG